MGPVWGEWRSFFISEWEMSCVWRGISQLLHIHSKHLCTPRLSLVKTIYYAFHRETEQMQQSRPEVTEGRLAKLMFVFAMG